MIVPLCKEKYFIEMWYTFDPIEFAKLHFIIDHIRINLCLPYILKLYQMAMEGINTDDSNNKNQIKPVSSDTSQNLTTARNSKSTKSTVVFNSNNSTASKSSNNDENANKNNNNNNNNKLKVAGRVNLPDVVLFAEPEKPNSKILNMNVRFA